MSDEQPQQPPTPRYAPPPTQAQAPGYPRQVAPKPHPDLARGYQSLVAFTQPLLSVVFPVLGLFLIGVYGLGLGAWAGLAGPSLMLAFIGWLCIVGGVVTSGAIVRRMVKDFVRSGSYFSALLWLGIVLPSFGLILILISPLASPYAITSGSLNGFPMLGLFVVCVILTPLVGLTQAMSVRRVERGFGSAGVSALWAFQQGNLSREHQYLAQFAVPQQFAQPTPYVQQPPPVQQPPYGQQPPASGPGQPGLR